PRCPPARHRPVSTKTVLRSGCDLCVPSQPVFEVLLKTTLFCAAFYNFIGGACLLLLFDTIGPLVGWTDRGPAVLRMFVAGTAITYGCASLAVLRDFATNRPLLFYGTGLKY